MNSIETLEYLMYFRKNNVKLQYMIYLVVLDTPHVPSFQTNPKSSLYYFSRQRQTIRRSGRPGRPSQHPRRLVPDRHGHRSGHAHCPLPRTDIPETDGQHATIRRRVPVPRGVRDGRDDHGQPGNLVPALSRR